MTDIELAEGLITPKETFVLSEKCIMGLVSFAILTSFAIGMYLFHFGFT
jgi:hypothetical protein